MRKLVILGVAIAVLLLGAFWIFDCLEKKPALPQEVSSEGTPVSVESSSREKGRSIDRARRNAVRTMLEAVKNGAWFSSQSAEDAPRNDNDVFAGPCKTTIDKDLDGSPEESVSFVYNEFGEVLEKITVKASGEKSVEEFERDEWGEISSIRKNGVLSISRETEYSESGDLALVKVDLTGDGQVDLQEKKVFDEDGRLMEQVDSIKGGIPMTKVVYAYDDDDRLLFYRVDPIAPPGAPPVGPILKFEFTYDENGRLTSRRTSGKSSSETGYSYDSEGNVVSETEYKNDSEDPSLKRTYTYDSAGNKLTEEIDEDGDGTADAKKFFNYDCWG